MASFVVTTLADAVDAGDGVVSLREALALANGNGATPDTITFAAGLAGGTLFLTSGQQLEITTDGIAVDGDIDRDGTPDIAISGSDASRVIYILGSAALNGLVIQDGNAVGDVAGDLFEGLGGAIWVVGALTLTNSTVSGNNSPGGGGGIFGGHNTPITLTNSIVSGNSADFDGGGIFGFFNTAITLTNSTVSGNSAGYHGGGIYVYENNPITLINSTVSGNSAGGWGGGIYGRIENPITLINSTVTGNSAGINGGGISHRFKTGGSSATTLTNSIVAGNAATGQGDDLFGGGGTYGYLTPSDLVFTGGNIVGSAPTGFDSVTGVPTAQIDGTSQAALESVFVAVAPDPDTGVLSGVLADNGGGVETVAIGSNSIAHGAGDNSALPADTADLDDDGDTTETLPVDARGAARIDGDDVDIGAFEWQAAPHALVVTTLDDEDETPFGRSDFLTETADGNGLSLREAVALAARQSNFEPVSITFDAGLAGGTLVLTHGSLFFLTPNITIDGDVDRNGTPDIVISGRNTGRVIDIGEESIALNGLVIQDGNESGIIVGTTGELTLTNSTVSGNSTSSFGGGIYGSLGAVITLTNVTVSGNSAGGNGGGIAGASDAAITLINSTVSGNSAGGDGGGIWGHIYNPITLIDSTVTGNSAGINGGGIYNRHSGVTTLTNSIVAGNAATGQGDDLFGGGVISGYTPSDLVFTGGNIIGSTPASFASVTGVPTAQIDGTDQAALETVFAAVAPDPDTGVLSGVLADNGGPVETVAITTGGIAHNAGDDTVLPADMQDLDHDGDVAEPLPVDARGLPRVVGSNVDIGAFESGDSPQNHPPVAVDDVVAVVEDATSPNLWPIVLGNDTDPDAGDSPSIASVDTSGTLGHVDFNAATQLLQYVADADAFDLLAPGATTTDSFSYTVVDGGGLTSTAVVTVEVTGGSDNQPRVRLGNGNDSRTGAVGEAEDSIFGENGDDSLSGLGGADTLDGGRGADTLNGGDGIDRLLGRRGDDSLSGLNGADTLDGGRGGDTLVGGDGIDWLFGRRGDDSLAGGAGPDVFVVAGSGGDDTVTGFLVGTDHLHLDGVAARHATLADVDHDGGADDLVIRLGSGSVTLLDTGAVANWQTRLLI